VKKEEETERMYLMLLKRLFLFLNLKPFLLKFRIIQRRRRRRRTKT
jgi:hypothetical protein